MPHSDRQQLHTLGIFVHGVLCGFHALGIAYNLRRRNWSDVGIHGLVFAYDLNAALRHHREVHRPAPSGDGQNTVLDLLEVTS